MFLSGEGCAGDYWSSERDLELYDAFFGERIAWKWAGALGELVARGWRPPEGRVLDFGCGSGAAARAYLEAFGAGDVRLQVTDRSPLARSYAARSLAELYPGLEVEAVDLAALERGTLPPPSVLLVSHVLTELDAHALQRLLDLARRAKALLWVEPGQRDVSQRLSQVHDELYQDAHVLAPCPHARSCGALGHPDAWCHHFARPPVEAFTTREWTLFSQRLGIDLRSLPFAWLALEHGPAVGEQAAERDAQRALAPAPGEPVDARFLGRPRLHKGRLTASVCFAGEVRELTLLDRDAKPLAKLLREPKGRPLLARIELEGDRIVRGEAL